MQSEIDALNVTKSQMVWLLKQVITLESKQKILRERKLNKL